jgi:large subunit ribosomal protein L12e
VVKIAREAQAKSMAANLQGVVLECLGTAVSVGCTIDGEHPATIQAQIKAGRLKCPEK